MLESTDTHLLIAIVCEHTFGRYIRLCKVTKIAAKGEFADYSAETYLERLGNVASFQRILKTRPESYNINLFLYNICIAIILP